MPASAKPDQIKRVVELVLENWDEIGVVEGDGVLHLPATLKKRAKNGGIVEEQIYLRNITNAQRMKARTRSRQWANELGLDLDRDRDLVDDLENYEILAYAVRDGEWVMHYQDGAALFKAYEAPSLQHLWATYDAWVRMQHPGFGTWDGAAIWQVIAKVRAQQSIAPLAVMPGFEQASCVLFMAREAALSPNAPWSRPSPATSTLAL